MKSRFGCLVPCAGTVLLIVANWYVWTQGVFLVAGREFVR